MKTFGKQQGGGRRRDARASAILPASVRQVARSGNLALVDISCTGARLTGADAPDVGKSFVLKIDRLEVFATVAWRRGDLLGVHFEDTLADAQVRLLRKMADMSARSSLTLEQQQAFEDWSTGTAR